MEEFTIAGKDSFLTIRLVEVLGFPDDTSHWGGYDVRAGIYIQVGGFSVNSTLWTSTGELYELYQQLRVCNESVKGTVRFESYEHQLEFTAQYTPAGQLILEGVFSEFIDSNNKLIFTIITDQSYIQSTLMEMQKIVQKYGGMEGVK
ncbi:WapI family immunity protein [Hymenobacter rigui]|uniref:Uncharacterized protein n=1 Tax=Hymenobacter rigui TaxID=334424 RepID=A0A428KU37_9BACT|nr:hypothetical protein [Hymenobacter rigui]RSK50033.1 hypothetical protein EI291_05115 [Hymenobacter rigui]